MAEETRSLWEQFDSEVEPWRRGRFVLVVIGLCYFILQALSVVAQIILGSIEQLFAFSTGCVIFWLQFYFIWIGVHWIRWLAGAWAGLLGFCLLIWSLRDSNAMMAFFGSGNLLVGSYFCLSSSVYFFAKRQAEKRNRLHSVAVAAVFGLLLFTFCVGSVGLSAYKTRIEEDARDFADDAFIRIFSDHDAYFFVSNITERTLASTGGSDQLTRFVQQTSFNPGEVDEMKPATGQLRVSYSFPASLACTADMTTEGITIYGRIQIHMRIIDAGKGWKIDAVWWKY